MLIEQLSPKPWDERRDLIVPGDEATTITYCVEHFIHLAANAVRDQGFFFVALSGGSTPKAIFQKLSSSAYKDLVPWNKCHFFWSDERSVSPDDPDSNYHMALSYGLKDMPIPKNHIHRMKAESDIEQNAQLYEEEIKKTLKTKPFDLIMLGMGEDGHTASLFPGTKALKITDRLVVANHVPQKETWRMSFTYPCINASQNIAIYVLGKSKKKILADVLFSTSNQYPIEGIGTTTHKALWIADEAAAGGLVNRKTRS